MDMEHDSRKAPKWPAAVDARNLSTLPLSVAVRGNNSGSRHDKMTNRDESNHSHSHSHIHSNSSSSSSVSSSRSCSSGRTSGRCGTHGCGGRSSVNGGIRREDDEEYGYYNNEPGVHKRGYVSDIPFTAVERDIVANIMSRGRGGGGKSSIDVGRRGRGGGGRKSRSVVQVVENDEGVDGVEDYSNLSDIPLTGVQRDLKAARASRGRVNGSGNSSGMSHRGGGGKGNGNGNGNVNDDEFTKGQEPAAKGHGCMTTATAMKLVRPRNK